MRKSAGSPWKGQGNRENGPGKGGEQGKELTRSNKDERKRLRRKAFKARNNRLCRDLSGELYKKPETNYIESRRGYVLIAPQGKLFFPLSLLRFTGFDVKSSQILRVP